jgi:hypothetical protein
MKKISRILMIVILSFFLLSTATNAQNPEAYVDNDTGQTTGDVDRGQSVGDNDTGQGGGGNDPNANIGSGCVNVAAGTPCNGGAGKCGAGGVCVPNTGGSGCLAGTSCNGGAGTCNASGACIPSPNVSLCAGLNAQDCVDMGCSWSNSDLSCSQ